MSDLQWVFIAACVLQSAVSVCAVSALAAMHDVRDGTMRRVFTWSIPTCTLAVTVSMGAASLLFAR